MTSFNYYWSRRKLNPNAW